MPTSRRGLITPVLLATSLLLVGANLGAYAAAGRPLLLGEANRAAAPTTVRNTGRGTALVLKSSAKSPPLVVTSQVKVPHLNADRVDGLEGRALQTRDYDYVVPTTDEGKTQDVTVAPPPGRYLVSYSLQLDFDSDADHFSECSLGLHGSDRRGFSTPQAASVGGRSVVYSAHATAEVMVTASGLLLSCDSLDPFRIETDADDVQSTLDLVRLDTVVTGTPGVLTAP